MKQELTPQEFAKQLRKPEGKVGLKIGEFMNAGNKDICLNSYKLLAPTESSKVVEIGMGNGLYISNLLSIAEEISYVGVDFSQLMIDEASKINTEHIKNGKVSFEFSSIEEMSFENDSVDFITTTNTVYFWPNILENAKELLRILKPGGKLLIGYRSKEFMDKLEVANYGFNKYTINEVENVLEDAGFSNVSSESIKEPMLKINGQELEMSGVYTTAYKG